MLYNPIGVGVGSYATQSVMAPNACEPSDIEDITGDFPNWGTDDASIATVDPAAQVNGISEGSTTHFTSGEAYAGEGHSINNQCPKDELAPQAGTNVGPVPVNYKLTSAEDDGGGVEVLLDSFFSWQSSDGKLADLSSCKLREYTTYPSTNNSSCTVNGTAQECYFPPSPPWSAQNQSGSGYPNPTSPTPGSATGGTSEDQNTVSNLNFVTPYSASSFAATQYVQYSCSSSGPWTNLYGPIMITRSMAKNSSGKWAVTVSRSDTSFTSTYVIPNQ